MQGQKSLQQFGGNIGLHDAPPINRKKRSINRKNALYNKISCCLHLLRKPEKIYIKVWCTPCNQINKTSRSQTDQ
jgi:hypothetical protein